MAGLSGLTWEGNPVDLGAMVELMIREPYCEVVTAEAGDAWRIVGNLVIVGPAEASLAIVMHVFDSLDEPVDGRLLSGLAVCLLEPLIDIYIDKLAQPLAQLVARPAFRAAMASTIYDGPPQYEDLARSWRAPDRD